MLIYSAAKAALMNMVTSLAIMLAPDNITVNNIAPGTIYTDRNAKVLKDKTYENKVRSIIPMKYIGQPEDIVGLAVFISSEESRYMTGQDIYVDGGKSIQ